MEWDIGAPVDPANSRIHGQCNLPPGYGLRILPFWAQVHEEPIGIASTTSVPKMIASLVQIGSALVTLYRARGS
jgi:hypothetical protein